MTTRRSFLALVIPSIALAQAKDHEVRLKDCLDREAVFLDRESTPFSIDSNIKLAIESRNFDDATAFRLAIADVIHDHFSRWIAIDSAAKTRLDIIGSSLSQSGLQLVMLKFGWKSYQIAKSEAKGVAGIIEGFFEYKSAGELVSGERANRVERVREMAFGLLSDIQEDLAHLKE